MDTNNKKLCPLFNTPYEKVPCREKGCALWDNANKACCFVSLVMELIKSNETNGYGK